MQSLDVNPRDPSGYVNLGKLSLEGGDSADADEFFGEALTIDPADEEGHARNCLTHARGRPDAKTVLVSAPSRCYPRRKSLIGGRTACVLLN